MEINLNEGLRAPSIVVRKSILVLMPLVILKGDENTMIGNSRKQYISYTHSLEQGCTIILFGYSLFCFMFIDSMLKREVYKDSLDTSKKDYCGITICFHN